jgi:multiple antibiotic resistance protein
VFIDWGSAFLQFFLFTFLSLFPMLNPIGMSALFLQITRPFSHVERTQLARRVALNSCILLIIVLFLGSSILRVFGVSLDFIRIAGGLLVANAAWEALQNKDPMSAKEGEQHGGARDMNSVAFFPLTMPITAGSGSIAAMIAIDTDIQDPLSIMGLFQYLGTIGGVVVACLTVWLCYASAQGLFNRLGTAGTKAVTSLSALIILAVGVQIFWQGLSPLLKGLFGR